MLARITPARRDQRRVSLSVAMAHRSFVLRRGTWLIGSDRGIGNLARRRSPRRAGGSAVSGQKTGYEKLLRARAEAADRLVRRHRATTAHGPFAGTALRRWRLARALVTKSRARD
jgi:hypothetical protein